MKGIVTNKNTIPILSCVLIEVLDNQIRINGTDLNIWSISQIEASETKIQGSFVVHLKTLSNAVRIATNELKFEVVETFDANDKEVLTLNLTSGGTLKIEAVNAEQFPIMPELNKKSDTYKIQNEVWQDFIQKTVFAITKESGRFTLDGLACEFGKKGLRVISIDGHRLSLAETSDFEANKISKLELLPLDAVKFLQKINCDGKIKIDNNNFYFELENRIIFARKLTGTFPNYEMVIPKENDFEVKFYLQDLLKVLNQAKPFVNKSYHSIGLQPYNNNLIIKTINSESELIQKIVCDFPNYESLALMFDLNYLIDVLASFKGNQLMTLKFTNNSIQPLFEASVNDNDYKFVIMSQAAIKKDSPEEKLFQILSDDEKKELPMMEFVLPQVENPTVAKSVSKTIPLTSKLRPADKSQIVGEIETILQAMRQCVMSNNLAQEFVSLFGKTIDVMSTKLEMVK